MIRRIGKKLTENGGLSSVELLSSMIVFALISLGITSSTVTSVQTNRASQQKAVAVNLGHQVLECVKSQIAAGRPITATGAGSDCNPAGAPSHFTIAAPAASPGSGAFQGMTRIQATISWRSPLPDQIIVDTYMDT